MDNTLKIKKKNEAFIQFEGDLGVMMEMSEHFSFMVPGAKFHPKVRARIWDGIIKLLNMGNRTLYAGLYDKVLEFLSSRGYAYELEANGYYGLPGEIENVGFDTIQEFAKSLEICSQGKPIEVRDYQIDAVTKALQNKKILLQSPTSSGKSLILYLIIRYLQEQNPDFRFLIIVPTTSLVSQMHGDFNDYSSMNGWSAKDNIHKITAGEDKKTNKPIVCSTWQSIYKLPGAYFNNFDVIICDEAHKLAANSITGIFERATEVKYRIGCTGTVHDAKCHVMVLQGLTGPIYQVTTTKKLMDSGQVSDLKIKCLILKHSEEVRLAYKKQEYNTELGYIVTHDRRNKFIRNLALATEGTTLILYRFVEKQGEVLYNLIKEASVGREVFLISGSTSAEEREAIRHHANNNPSIVIASLGTTAAGVNLPAIENIIFAHPSKSKISNLQSIGRGLRLKDGKTHCTLFDIVDDMSHKKYINHVLRHFGERVKQYTTEQFSYDITRIDI